MLKGIQQTVSGLHDNRLRTGSDAVSRALLGVGEPVDESFLFALTGVMGSFVERVSISKAVDFGLDDDGCASTGVVGSDCVSLLIDE